VKLLFAADEENGSHYGIEWLLREHPDLFRPGDWALVPDGGDSRGETIEVAEKNIAWMRFTVSGAQSHGSRPDQGSNAFLAGSDLALRLHRGLYGKFNFRDSLFDPPYSTFEPTKKEANVPNINTIPGEDVFYYDMRILPRFPVEDVEAEVGRICRELEGEYPVRVGYSFLQRMESRPTAADSPLVKTLAGLIKTVYGVDPRPIGIGGGTVAAYLRNAGMDCAVWARIEENAHQPNESALVEYILGDAKVMALLARNAA
jgi:succinyl-diaminopimelate desuccinylase